MRLLRRAFGAYKLWMGFCPACNSDAPAIDTCRVCEYRRELLDDSEIKQTVWQRFAARGYR